MKFSDLLKPSFVGALLAISATQFSHAADVTLRLHQLLPAQATIPAKAIAPWAAETACWQRAAAGVRAVW